MVNLWKKFNCSIGNHEWTCHAEQGIKPNKNILNNKNGEFVLSQEEMMTEFFKYARVYCLNCGKYSKYNHL